MDRAKWDAMCKAQLEEYNQYIVQGPTDFARSTWDNPQRLYGGDKLFDRTRIPPRIFRYTIKDFVG